MVRFTVFERNASIMGVCDLCKRLFFSVLIVLLLLCTGSCSTLFGVQKEADDVVRASDFTLVKHYNSVNTNIRKKNYGAALSTLMEMRRLYPVVDRYTDCLFLEGFAWEQLGEDDSASEAYARFVAVAEKKYSSRFRGHRNTNKDNAAFIAEQNHARSYLNQMPDTVFVEKATFDTLLPKYYFSSNQPGFTINPEDLPVHASFSAFPAIGEDISGKIAWGVNFLLFPQKNFHLSTSLFFSEFMSEWDVSLPIQLFRAPTNRTGVKWTPFLRAFRFNNDPVSGNLWIDFGTRISTCRYLRPDLFVGAYYQYNYYNEHRLYDPSRLRLFTSNEYDLSLYFLVLKNLDLKVGIKNGGVVAGVYLGNVEFSYDVIYQRFILKTSVF